MTYLRPAIILMILMTLLTGILYPLAVTGLAQLFFQDKAQGSLIVYNHKVIGSALIGQNFTRADYFHGRPSATASGAYNTLASGGSNLAMSNPLLKKTIEDTITRLHQENPTATLKIPLDLVTSSASGLDPHISPESAYYQAPRIAHARQIPLIQIQQLIEKYTEQPPRVLGMPVINVLQLNMALNNHKLIQQ